MDLGYYHEKCTLVHKSRAIFSVFLKKINIIMLRLSTLTLYIKRAINLNMRAHPTDMAAYLKHCDIC